MGLALLSIFSTDGSGAVVFAGKIKPERVLRIQKDRVGIQNYFNKLEECSGTKKMNP